MSDRHDVHPVSIKAGTPKETVIEWLKITSGAGPKLVRIEFASNVSTERITRHLQGMRVKLSEMKKSVKSSGRTLKPFKMKNAGIGKENGVPYLDLERTDPKLEDLQRISKIMEGLEEWGSNADNR